MLTNFKLPVLNLLTKQIKFALLFVNIPVVKTKISLDFFFLGETYEHVKRPEELVNSIASLITLESQKNITSSCQNKKALSPIL